MIELQELMDKIDNTMNCARDVHIKCLNNVMKIIYGKKESK